MSTFASIQLLRFLAALLVVFNHSVHFVDEVDTVALDQGIVYLGRFGQAGVHIFFVISGFVIAYSSATRFGSLSGARQFLWRRILRIYPIYWVYGFVGLGMALVSQGEPSLEGRDLWGAMILLPNASSDLVFTGWTLSYEIFFYLCFASVFILPFWPALVTLSLAFLALVAIGLIVGFQDPFMRLATGPVLVEFVVGAWIAGLALADPRPRPRLGALALGLGLGGFVLGLAGDYNRLPHAISWGVPSALIVLGFVLRERAGRLPAAVGRLSWLGDSSYSLYLTHAVLLPPLVALLVSTRALSPTTSVVVMIALIPVCVLAGLIAYERVEKPLLQRLKEGFSAVSSTRRP